MLVDALTYPVRRSGWIMIFLGAILAVILDLLRWVPLLGILAAVFSAGYFGAFYLDIVSTTMNGRDDLPDWPDFTSFLEDIVPPFFRLVALVALSFAPALIMLAFGGSQPWYVPALCGSIAYGCLYFPMAVLATQAFGSVGAALPNVVLPGIFKALPSYILVTVALLFVLLVGGLAQAAAAKIPYVGWFVATAVGLYGMMFQARLIGLVYVDKFQKLGWE